MKILAETLARLKLTDPVSFRGLTVFPLCSDAASNCAYLTLDEALDSGVARVTEVSEEGRIPELRLLNDSDQSILLVDGEELVGARQNRILNLTILVPAKTSIVIPVSCVEMGRWSYQSREFRSAKRSLYARARAEKARGVSLSMQEDGSHRSDQRRLWADIALKQQCMRVRSTTSAMGDIYEQRESDVQEYTAAFPAKLGQVGAVFAIGHAVRGLELFDCAATFRKLAPKVLASYALDAAERSSPRTTSRVSPSHAKAFVDKLRHARVASFKAIAQGQDLRVDAGDIAGGALVVDNRVVHLAAFFVEAHWDDAMQPASNG